MDAPKTFTIGKLATAADVNVETIRYYQRLALIKEPAKPDQGYRQYSPQYVSRVRFIKRAKQLGFSLKEIRELLDLGDGHCQEVQQLARLKVTMIEERLKDLHSMQSALIDLLAQCEATDDKDIHCALIEVLGRELSTDMAGNPK